MIRKADEGDGARLLPLARALWTEHDSAELEADLLPALEDENAAVFLYEADAGAVGFAFCRLRRDYVEGTRSSPVGYLEGIYVDAEHRRRGIAAALVQRCEAWARDLGCAEFASDCELGNADSIAFHRGAGFAEANRLVCFVKRL